jgi:hypothetical protein
MSRGWVDAAEAEKLEGDFGKAQCYAYAATADYTGMRVLPCIKTTWRTVGKKLNPSDMDLSRTITSKGSIEDSMSRFHVTISSMSPNQRK